MWFSIGVKSNVRVSRRKEGQDGGGTSTAKATGHVATSTFALFPASLAALMGLSITARGRGLGEWGRERLGNLIPRKTRNSETAKVTANLNRLLVMGIPGTFIEEAYYTNFPLKTIQTGFPVVLQAVRPSSNRSATCYTRRLRRTSGKWEARQCPSGVLWKAIRSGTRTPSFTSFT